MQKRLSPIVRLASHGNVLSDELPKGAALAAGGAVGGGLDVGGGEGRRHHAHGRAHAGRAAAEPGRHGASHSELDPKTSVAWSLFGGGEGGGGEPDPGGGPGGGRMKAAGGGGAFTIGAASARPCNSPQMPFGGSAGVGT